MDFIKSHVFNSEPIKVSIALVRLTVRFDNVVNRNENYLQRLMPTNGFTSSHWDNHYYENGEVVSSEIAAVPPRAKSDLVMGINDGSDCGYLVSGAVDYYP